MGDDLAPLGDDWKTMGDDLGPMGDDLRPMGHYLGPMGDDLGPIRMRGLVGLATASGQLTLLMGRVSKVKT